MNTITPITTNIDRKAGLLVIFAICSYLCVIGIVQEKSIYLLAGLTLPFIAYLAKNPIYSFFMPYVFLVPFDEIAVMSGEAQGATYTRILGIAVATVFILNTFTARKALKLRKHILITACFIFFSVCSISWALSWEVAAIRIPMALNLLLLYGSAAMITVNRQHLRWIFLASITGGTIASIYSIYLYLTFKISFNTIERGALVIGENETDPNQLAFCLLMPLALALYQTSEAKSLKGRLIGILVCLILTIGIIITGSRGGMLGLTIIVLSFLQKFNWKRVILIGIVISITYVVAAETVINRFAIAVESGGAGRTSIWKVGLAAVEQSPLYGYGLSNFPLAYNEFRSVEPSQGVSRGSHSIYIGTLVELGVIGLFLLIYTLVEHFKILIRCRGAESDALKAALLAMLVAAVFLDVLWRKSLWLSLIVIAMYSSYRESNHEV